MGTLFANLGDLFSVMGSAFSILMSVWFILFPPLLYFLFKLIWMLHVNGHYGSKIKWVLLEIIPPRDIEKSPALMESIFSGFAGVMKSPTAVEEFLKGEFPTSFSLEMASIEGQVHFYVRTQAGFQNLVEAHFYAQYPGVEVVEVEDYTNLVPKTIPNKDWDLWGTDFVFVKPDLYPIKTYRFFEETVTGKMIDPLGGLIETMGKTGPGQYIWLQYIITPYSEKWYSTGQSTIDEFLGKEKKKTQGLLSMVFHDLMDVFMNIGKGMFTSEVTFGGAGETEKKVEQPLEFRLSPGQKKVLEALENNLGKQMFKTRMRHIYIGKRSVFSKQTGVSSFIGAIKQFNDFNLNSFKPDDATKTYANYIMTEDRLRFRQRRILRRYRNRDSDPQSTRFMLSTEELATIFHIPDMAVTAPTLTRVAARRGGAPMNLPLQELE
jgi:hypothetical protein